jgi:hypothetical protein
MQTKPDVYIYQAHYMYRLADVQPLTRKIGPWKGNQLSLFFIVISGFLGHTCSYSMTISRYHRTVETLDKMVRWQLTFCFIKFPRN